MTDSGAEDEDVQQFVRLDSKVLIPGRNLISIPSQTDHRDSSSHQRISPAAETFSGKLRPFPLLAGFYHGGRRGQLPLLGPDDYQGH